MLPAAGVIWHIQVIPDNNNLPKQNLAILFQELYPKCMSIFPYKTQLEQRSPLIWIIESHLWHWSPSISGNNWAWILLHRLDRIPLMPWGLHLVLSHALTSPLSWQQIPIFLCYMLQVVFNLSLQLWGLNILISYNYVNSPEWNFCHVLTHYTIFFL